MSNKNIENFIETYGPVAVQVSKEINVDPNVLLSQWGLESRWGQTEMAKKHHNLGGIKDFSGHGHEAKDNKTGSVDKYVKFEDPEVFGMYYADQIKRNFPLAINTGPDVGAFTRGLSSGKKGSYFEVTPQEYEKTLHSFQSAIPETKLLPFDGGESSDGAAAPAAAPAAAAPAEDTDAQREARIQAAMDAQEKRQAQMIGAGTGAGISATRAAGSGVGSALEAGAKRVGQGFSAGMQGKAPAPSSAPPAGAPSAPGQSIMRQPIPSGGPDGGRLAAGQTGTMPYNYGKAAGLTDIEAGRALDMTKQTGGVHDLATQRREGLNRIQSLFPTETYVENPRYGGIMTPDQGAGGGPKQSFSMKAPVPASPDLPQGQAGGLSQLPPRQPIPTTPKPPSGLETVTNMFKGMMKPVAAAVSTAGKYVLPPLSLASAAGEGVNIAQQARKPEGQRDVTGMVLSGANILGSGMSMFPPTAPIGVPLMLGTGAAQLYRDNPEAQSYIKKKMQGLADAPLLDEMTGPLP